MKAKIHLQYHPPALGKDDNNYYVAKIEGAALISLPTNGTGNFKEIRVGDWITEETARKLQNVTVTPYEKKK